MLKALHIENLAVIENADVLLGPHLNVFTGETGAGKSILIGGINAVLGQRVNRDIIRAGAEKAYISAAFDSLPIAVKQKMKELGIEDSDELIFSREISADGRGIARINSRPASVSTLRELGGLLINIHGQHDSQALLDPAQHLGILDGFGRLEPVLEDYLSSFRDLQAVAREISKIRQSEHEKAVRAAYLKSVVNDIGPLKIESGEDEAVEKRFNILDNAVELSKSVGNAVELLSGSDENSGAEGSILSAIKELSSAEGIYSEIKALNERLNSIYIELDDISGELSRISGSIDFDEGEYQRLSARRDELTKIKRRYGPELRDVIKLFEESLNELEKIGGSEEELKKLQKKKEELLTLASKKAEKLHNLRQSTADRFREEVEKELRFLNMPDVKLMFKLEKGKLTGTGMDNAEMLISSNIGEEPKPVAKIASGGELSRIMLALKSVLADRDDIPTLIFDEIDSGVSGRAAQKIGIKLREISRSRQVICVTHLAQIAIVGDTHILIEKSSDSSRTVTNIRPLDFEGRKLEIARILGGDNITETVLKDAEEQLLTALKE